MAAYTDAQKAAVYVALVSNEGNVKRTARDTGVPEATVRRWRDEWDKDGPPDVEELEEAVTEHLEDAERVANKALARIEVMIDNKEGTLAQVVTAYGVLRDKIDRVRGIGRSSEAPPAQLGRDQIRELLVGYTDAMRDLSAQREAEIIEAEIVEQPALPKGS